MKRLLPLVVALALFAACSGVADPEPTPTLVPSATPDATATPAAAPTPDPAVLLRDGGIAIIQLAYDRLLDEYIDPLEPAPLLDAAWDAMALEAQNQGLAPPAKPVLGTTRADALAAFAQAYVPFANSVADPTKLRYAALLGMTQSLRDCHTFFLSPVASDNLIDQRAGKGTVGIGIELVVSTPPLVGEVITGGPAARAGVLVGDRILTVDGEPTGNRGPNSTLELINGDENTTVRLGLSRGGEQLELSINRERVTPPNVESRVIEGTTIGYVRLRHFVDGGVKPDLQQALQAFEAQGVTGWIIDIRGNPGGRLDAEAISLFVKDGVVVRDRGRDIPLEEIRATGDLLPAIRPTILMTNNRTGSVSEIFAAALQEYGVARTLGTATNGCVGYTDVREFGDGTSMAVTTHVHLGPVTNRELNGVGVLPDIAVTRSEADVSALRDPQLEAAIAALR